MKTPPAHSFSGVRTADATSYAATKGRSCCDSPAAMLQGSYTEALGKYAMALSYINEDFMVQLEGPHADRAHGVRLPIHLNMAACQIRLSDWHGAVWNCSQVLLYSSMQ